MNIIGNAIDVTRLITLGGQCVYYYYYYYYLLFSLALQPTAGYNLLVTRGYLITHNDAPQSVGLLRTSDQLVAETST
jgi:hypothetical protein